MELARWLEEVVEEPGKCVSSNTLPKPNRQIFNSSVHVRVYSTLALFWVAKKYGICIIEIMKINFRDITQDNFYESMRLSVRKDQPFVASNAFSVAESKLFPFWITKAIYADEQMVGFLMYAIFYEVKELYLCRFMIDVKFQGKGYGKGALDLLKEIAMEDQGIEKMKLSTRKDNANGIRIYEKFGFKDTHEMEDNEEVFVMDLAKGL